MQYIYTSAMIDYSSSSALSLSKWLIGNFLCLVHLGRMALGAQWVRQFRLRQRLEVRSVLLMGLTIVSSAQTILAPELESRRRNVDRRTKGRPQYVHQQICGLSTLMKILGCPRGPPPPSHFTVRSWVQRTGCLWMSSIAAYGRG